MELAKLIRITRHAQTQEQFAASIGATKQQVSDWERGVYQPQEKHLAAMGIELRYERTEPNPEASRG